MPVVIQILLFGIGVFGVVLGLLHFTFPVRFAYRAALEPHDGPQGEFVLGPYRHKLTRRDLLGIIAVMNNPVSYAIVLCGVFDLAAPWWLGTPGGALGSLAVGGFWFTRAISQFAVGRTRNNWLVFGYFLALAGVQGIAAI
jgi:hypothetical protein